MPPRLRRTLIAALLLVAGGDRHLAAVDRTDANTCAFSHHTG